VSFNAREYFTRFAAAVNARDKETLRGMFHPEFSAWTPQSGERSTGFDSFWAQLETYPGGAPEMPILPDVKLLQDDDRWAITPSYTVVPLSSAHEFTVISRTTYPDGSVWQAVSLVEMRDELIIKFEFFFAPELPAPLLESMATYGGG
jgi:hypothetical protein